MRSPPALRRGRIVGRRAYFRARRGYFAARRGYLRGRRRLRQTVRRRREASSGSASGPTAARSSQRMARDERIERLTRDPDPTTAAVGRALAAAIASERDADEHAWETSIEELRAEMGASEEVVRVRESAWTGDPRDHETLHMTPVAELALKASKPARWGRVLYHLVRELQPARSLEFGTCVGLSAAYQAAARGSNGAGDLVTLEADPARAEIAARNLERLGLGHARVCVGRFEETLADAVADAPVAFAFVDGHHQEQATRNYFRTLSTNLASPAVLLFDDIEWSEPMRRVWRWLRERPEAELAVDLGGIGLLATGTGRTERLVLDVPLFRR